MPAAFLDHPGPLAFAHRGGAAHAPENSWRAFEHAASLGYGYLETDLQATADGVLLAFHDRTLARVTGQPGRISRMTYREVARARINGTEPIPVLADLLGAWPGMRFNIDVKDTPAIRPLAEVLRRANAWDRVCVFSFSAARLRATRRALDRPVCIAASPLAAVAVRFGGPRPPRDGHAGRHGHGLRGPRLAPPPARPPAPPPPRPGGTLLPVPRPLPVRPSVTLAERLARAGVRCVQVPAYAATESFIGRAHALGLQVHAWTVNDPAVMANLLDLGVDGIMSDETVALRDVLASRGQWHPRVAGAGA
jgi:glycerophosphoryl diester phosphodiesterase